MPIRIDCDFPGGNIIVDHIEGDLVRLHQDLRDTAADWFYWCFRVRGAEGRTLRFEFTESRAIGVRGPAVSYDRGTSWKWLGTDCVDGNSFTYACPVDAHEARLSFAMPYQDSHWRAFAATLADNPHVQEDDFCHTRKGRPVERVLLGALGSAEPLFRAALTCRHHCCEMMANDALEGLIRYVAEDLSDDAVWLREHVQFFLVPFADKDGVEDGDQGKCRAPRDHGRDYQGDSIYPTPAAIRDVLPGWGGDKLRLAIDLHCPWIAGTRSETIYMVGSSDDRLAAEQKRFSAILESCAVGPLPVCAEDYLPYGVDWNTGQNSADGKGFGRWSGELPGIALAGTIEIPYANARGAEVTQETARLFGKDLGLAISSYLRELQQGMT